MRQRASQQKHKFNGLISAPAAISADEFLFASAIGYIWPADQIGSTETGYAISGAGSASTKGSADLFLPLLQSVMKLRSISPGSIPYLEGLFHRYPDATYRPSLLRL